MSIEHHEDDPQVLSEDLSKDRMPTTPKIPEPHQSGSKEEREPLPKKEHPLLIMPGLDKMPNGDLFMWEGDTLIIYKRMVMKSIHTK